MAIFTAIAVAATAAAAYSQVKSGQEQRKAARVANNIERRKQLAAMRKAQRMNEAMAVASGTTGASSQIGQAAAIASSTAQTLGQQTQELAAAGKISHWNNMATGFGVLGELGQIGMAMPAKQEVPDVFKVKQNPNT